MLSSILVDKNANRNSDTQTHGLMTPKIVSPSRRLASREFLLTHKSINWKSKRQGPASQTDHLSLDKKENSFDLYKRLPKPGSLTHRGVFSENYENKNRSLSPNKKPAVNHMTSGDVILERHKNSVQSMMFRIGERERTIVHQLDRRKQSLSQPAYGATSFRQTSPIQAIPSSFSTPRSLKIIQEVEKEDQAWSTPRLQISSKDTPNSYFTSSVEDMDIDPLNRTKEETDNTDDVFDDDELYDDDEEDDTSTSSSSSRPKKRSKPLTSADFETDLESQSEGEDEPIGKRRSLIKNRTKKNYRIACAKYQMKTNPTFLRQTGQASVNMRNRMLTYRDAKPLAVALVADKTTSFLDVSQNPIGPLGTAYIAEMMYANRFIIELNLSSTKPGQEGLDALTQALSQNKVLRRLYLNHNFLGQEAAEHLSLLITNVPDLRELHLSHNALGAIATKRIAAALSSNRGKLAVLDLQYNNIRTDSAIKLALSLLKNKTLKNLNVAWNGFGVEGCRALGLSLAVNKTLQEMDLTCNRIGVKSLAFLLKGLAKNSGLTHLKLDSNPMTTEGAKSLIETVKTSKCSRLSQIGVLNIPVDEDFVKLTQELQSVRAVEVLHDTNIHMATVDQTQEHEGTNLSRFDPITVMFEYMKKDNLRLIDLFQFFDIRKRDKLSRGDLKDGFTILMIPFTEDNIDVIVKTLDKNRDGFITLDEMMKGYRENDRMVKLRRIKASKNKRKDNGLEDLWQLLKEIIAKRKEENEKRKGQQSKENGEGAKGRRMSRRMSKIS